MDSVGTREEVKLAPSRRRHKLSTEDQISEGTSGSQLDLPVNCNCDSSKRGQQGNRVSLLAGNCPKFYLFAWLLLCLIATSQSLSSQQQQQPMGLPANQSETPIISGHDQMDRNASSSSGGGRDERQGEGEGAAKGKGEGKGASCLPLIGALLGIGAPCEPPTETTTAAAAAAASSGLPAMRYESLKVNQSATWRGPQWSESGQQVKEAAREPSIAASEPRNASGAGAKANQPRALSSAANLNVLCNSRCNCVILDLSSQQAARLVTPDTIKPSSSAAVAFGNAPSASASAPASVPASASASASVPASVSASDSASASALAPAPAPAADSASGSSAVSGSGSGDGADADQANRALIAFNEDYSLDYDQPQLEQEPQLQQQQQQQQILLAGSNPSSAQTTYGADQSTRQPQLQQPQESSGLQKQQLSPAVNSNSNSNNDNNNLHLFPLQHHLQTGSGKASPPQLYAQSLYSSQAPKLSYHAHAPYFKQSLAPSSSPSSFLAAPSSASASSLQANTNSYLSQNPQSGAPSPSSNYFDGAPPSGAQTNFHHYLHHNLRSSYHHNSRYSHSSPIQIAGRQLQTDGHQLDAPQNEQFTRQLQLKALIPLKVLNASNWEHIRQTDSLSSFIVSDYHNAHLSDAQLNAIADLLTRAHSQDVQSLILSRNNIEFEYWTELYALLATTFRTNLYHLDLSYNSIIKLGITFTGYLEHHLAVHDGIWLQPSNPKPLKANLSHNEIVAAKGATNQQQKVRLSGGSNGRMNSLLNGGKLYSLMQTRLSGSNLSSTLWTLAATNKTWQGQLLAQPMLIRALDLSHNKLKWLINDQFKALKHIQTIRIDHNRIRYIHQHAFSGLESLRYLNLNYNRLQVIYIEQFQSNYNLLALMLRSNYLAYLRGGSFASLSQLKRLDLSQNKLTILSNNAFIGLESLELLNCSSNQFAHAPSGSFHPLTSLKRLDLSNNLISQLAPGTFFHLPVEELWLGQNDQLVSIERGALWDLPYLTRLHLSSNPMLTSINSQSFVSTQNLQYIEVDNCQSLDADARQLLDNITMTATSRQLRLEQQQSIISTTATTTPAAASPQISPAKEILVEPAAAVKSIGGNNSLLSSLASASPSPQQMNKLSDQQLKSNNLLAGKQHLQQSKSLITMLYYLGTITVLFVALALVFRYTSTSHYMETMRRRRRVYGLDSSTGQHRERQQQQSDRKYSISSGYSDSQLASPSECDSVFVCTSDQLVAGTNRQEAGQFELYESANNVILQQQRQQQPQPQPQPESEAATGSEPESQTNNSGEGQEEGLDISVINVSPPVLCCPDCGHLPVPPKSPVEGPSAGRPDEEEAAECCGQQLGDGPAQVGPALEASDSQVNQRPSPSIDLIHSQLIAAGFDYGHANCAHFYQSLGPALQLADLTANFVNSMDFY